MSKQPLRPTSHNICLDWCRQNNKKLANLKRADFMQIIQHGVKIGAMIGVQETKKVYEQALTNSVKTTEDAPATYEPVEPLANHDLSEK